MALIAKSNSNAEPYQYISRQDPAVDTDDPDFDAKWQVYLDGKGEPPLRPGQKPTVFVLRPLRTYARNALAKVCSDSRKGDMYSDAAPFVAACALSLMGIENFRDGAGNQINVVSEYDEKERVHVLSEKSLDAIGQDVAIEIGIEVMRRTYGAPK